LSRKKLKKETFFVKVLSERSRSSAAGLASELKIKSYFTLKIPRSSTAGSLNSAFRSFYGNIMRNKELQLY